MSSPKRLYNLFFVVLALIISITVTSAQDGDVMDCPSDTMLDVSAYQQTQNYARPILNVRCDDEVMMVTSNGITNYEFVAITPNDLQAQNHAWHIPLNPEFADAPSGIPLLSSIGIAVNGLPLFGPNEAPRDDYGDPFLDQILDFCNGHTAQGGLYHYHARPECLFEDMEGNPSLVLGWSFDGYPILAPYACVDAACSEVIEVQSSYQRTQNVRNGWEAHDYIEGSGDLDVCNGMTLPDGSYAYYATDTFPYFMGCYMGTPLLEENGTMANLLAPVGNQPYDFDNMTNGGQGQNQGGQGGNNPPPNGGGNNSNPPPPPPPPNGG